MASQSRRAEDIEDDNKKEGAMRDELKTVHEIRGELRYSSPASQNLYYLRDIAESLRILAEGMGYPRVALDLTPGEGVRPSLPEQNAGG